MLVPVSVVSADVAVAVASSVVVASLASVVSWAIDSRASKAIARKSSNMREGRWAVLRPAGDSLMS